MGRAARVTSLEVIDRFAAALRTFQEEASVALADLDIEANRALGWIQQDRPRYWTTEVRLGWDRVTEARLEIERARTYRSIGNHQPSCREEKAVLDKMQRRLRIAQERVKAVRHWANAIDRTVIEMRGEVNQLARWVEIDLPKAITTLQRMAQALESYVGRSSGTMPKGGTSTVSDAMAELDEAENEPDADEKPDAEETQP